MPYVTAFGPCLQTQLICTIRFEQNTEHLCFFVTESTSSQLLCQLPLPSRLASFLSHQISRLQPSQPIVKFSNRPVVTDCRAKRTCCPNNPSGLSIIQSSNHPAHHLANYQGIMPINHEVIHLATQSSS